MRTNTQPLPRGYTSDEESEKIYDDMQPKTGGVGAGTLVRKALDAGYRGGIDGTSATEKFAGFQPATTNTSADTADGYPEPKTASELAYENFVRAAYVWSAFLLAGHVNLLYGDGGTGKTLLALHVAVAVAAGIALYGHATIPMPVLLVLAEDDYGETKARLEAICRMLGIELSKLPITIWCLPGLDANIARIRDDGTWEAGPFLEPLRTKLTQIGPCLLVFDTVSDAASLDETKRLPVNTLCKKVFGALCREQAATVLVCAHPSKAAMADGSNYSGSTAWNNAVRNRLTLERGEGKGPRRILSVAKSNYGSESELELFLVGATSFARVVTGDVGSSETAVFDRLYSAPPSPNDYQFELGQHVPELPLNELSKLNAEAGQYVHSLGLPGHLGTRLMNAVMEGQKRFHNSTPEQQELYFHQTGARLKQIFGDRVSDAINAADALIGKSDFALRFRGGLLSPEAMNILIMHADRQTLRKTMAGGS